jgi:hypothetical protein
MNKKNTNNIILSIVKLIKEYKYFCLFYFLCLALFYPIYYFINEHNVKYYNFTYDLNSTSPLMVRQDKPVIDLKKLNKSINVEIYNQIYSVITPKDTRIQLNCVPIELENNCLIKIKNGYNKILISINESIMASIKRVNTKYKSKLNEEIRRYTEDIKLLGNSSKIINQIFNNENVNIAEAKDLGSVLEILTSNSLKVNELNSEIKLIKAEVKEVENFISQIEFQLNKQVAKAATESSFQNYSFKIYFLTIIVGSILMIFSFLILIKD